MLCRNAKCTREISDDYAFCPWCGKKQALPQRTPRSRGNGQGSVYKLPNGKYRATVTLAYYIGADGKVKRQTRSRTFDKKKDAVAILPTLATESVPNRETVRDMYEVYTRTNAYDKLSDSQVRKLTTAWKRLEPLHHVRMEQLTIDLMQRVIDEATSTYYPARDMKIMLSHLMDEAVKREIIPRNKTDYIELPELKESKKDAFNRDEIRQIWDSWHSGDRMAGVVLMMIYTGMRKGELMTIQRKNIYLDKRYMIGGIKTEAGIDRVIAIPAEIADVMEQLLADSTSPTPFSMSTDDFYDSYYATLERSGVRRLNPHCCRHTFFTWLIASGVDSVIAAEMGGHADISMTKQYTHTPIDAKIAAADRLRLQP